MFPSIHPILHVAVVYLNGPGRGVLVSLARQPKGTDTQEALLITAELQKAAVLVAHLLLYQLHCSLHLCHL